MKYILPVALAALATAAPAPADEMKIFERQLGGGRGSRGATVSNDLINGECKKVTFIWARASGEPNNMGTSMGPLVCTGLKKAYNNDVACQGVSEPDYTASLMDNVRPSGTSATAVTAANKLFEQANSKCPNSIIVAGGYSQGTAVMMNAVSKLQTNIKNKVKGVVLFGYTKNAQQKGGIPNYPKENVAVYCPQEDGVCNGRLSVTAGHFVYMNNGDGPKAITFLQGKIGA